MLSFHAGRLKELIRQKIVDLLATPAPYSGAIILAVNRLKKY
jgi:hypothetical protein